MSPGSLIAILAGVSLLLIAIGVPMALGKVPPNSWYGVRLPITLRSRAAWDAANIQYGWWLVLGGGLSLPALLLGWYLGSNTVLVTLYLIVLLGSLIGGIVPCVLAASRAEDDPSAEDEHDSVPPQFR